MVGNCQKCALGAKVRLMSSFVYQDRRADRLSAAIDDLRILLVEDDDADAYLIKRALSAHPGVSEVIHARDGAHALTLLQACKTPPDMAFIDLHMPVKDGFELLTDLGATGVGGGMPLFVLTSSTSELDARKSKLRSAIRVIVKPESILLLEKALSMAIEGVYPSVRARRSKRDHAMATSRLAFSGIDDSGDDCLTPAPAYRN